MMDGIARSLLFVPGHRPERFDKAVASGAHAIVLDLEDAVAPADKLQARESVAAWLAAGHFAYVRINAAHTPWYQDDVRMLKSAPSAGLMLPKADWYNLARTIETLSGRKVIALLETVAGYLGLRAMAGVAGLERIAFGSVDFATESAIADEGEAMTAVRVQIALESFNAGLAAPVDGVCLNFNDEKVMHAEASRSCKLGFGGKLCIHPRQVGPVNAAFRPTAQDALWAERVLGVFEASGGAATSLDGHMIDKPVVDRAQRIIDEYKRVGAA